MNSGAYRSRSLKPPTFDTIGAADRLNVIACCVGPRVRRLLNRAEGHPEQQSSWREE
jgi:hypothetical protein